MKRPSLILPGFRRVLGQTPPGFQNMCTENAPPPHSPCFNPRGRRSLGFSPFWLKWPAWQGAAQRKTFIYHPLRKQGRRSWRRNARAKKGTKGLFFRREQESKIYVYSHLLTLPRFFFGFHSRPEPGPITQTPFLAQDRWTTGLGNKFFE